jgi:hypothetical protein
MSQEFVYAMFNLFLKTIRLVDEWAAAKRTLLLLAEEIDCGKGGGGHIEFSSTFGIYIGLHQVASTADRGYRNV